jgi:hypothetical protein
MTPVAALDFWPEYPLINGRQGLGAFNLSESRNRQRRGEVFLMDYNFETPFDNIENAQEYLALLSQALEEATANAEADILGHTNSDTTRRRDALRLVLYKLEKLEQHIKISRRLLNALRTLRRLLLDERAEPVASLEEKAG